MTTQTLLLAESPLDGTSVTLTYDDVTLLATKLTFVAPNSLGSPLTVNVVLNGVGMTFQAPPSASPGQYTFPTPLQGVVTTTRFGTHGLDFGFSSFGFGTVGVNPVPGNTTIHVTPHG